MPSLYLPDNLTIFRAKLVNTIRLFNMATRLLVLSVIWPIARKELVVTDLPAFSAPPITGLLVLADGRIFEGQGFGREGSVVGEICFNTAMSGYQEILTDPSYAEQIITFTFPHIGNVGTNEDDNERDQAFALGVITREAITDPANFRSTAKLDHWCEQKGLVGLSGVDTRALVQKIRTEGAPSGVIAYDKKGIFDRKALIKQAQDWAGLEGMDLAKKVTNPKQRTWNATAWTLENGYGTLENPKHHVVAIDYGAKDNILRRLASSGMRVTVVGAETSAADIMALEPDGIFLSNGPGDPAATGDYALPIIRDLIASGKPIFGICLGHQLLALAFGGHTFKMHQGHRGANHPVQDLRSGKVEITSMNHGFAVSEDGLPEDVIVTHKSLFDETICGIAHKSKPIFSVQQHPEASPGPQDSFYLFDDFMKSVTDSLHPKPERKS